MSEQGQYDVPVLLLFFNRPRLASKIIERLRIVRPTKLYIAIDGPRHSNESDKANVSECVQLIDTINWQCEIKTLIRDTNLGCRVAVSEAITWFFNDVESGIILEDDCLPDPSFFPFCKVLLELYAHDDRIMHIGGTNLYNGKIWTDDSYMFSYIAHIWGWATWRRAWQLYDVNMIGLPKFLESGHMNGFINDRRSREYWKIAFKETYNGNVNTWDYQWVYTIWKNGGLTIVPAQNLVSNTGFGAGATHTNGDSKLADLQTFPINISELKHPYNVSSNAESVMYAFREFYQSPLWWERAINYVERKIMSK